MEKTRYKMETPQFFEPGKAQKVLMDVRKKQAIVEFVKADGTPRSIEGVVCYNENRHQFVMNQELDSITEPSFRTIPLSRLVSVTVDGKKMTPPRKKILIEEKKNEEVLSK